MDRIKTEYSTLCCSPLQSPIKSAVSSEYPLSTPCLFITLAVSPYYLLQSPLQYFLQFLLQYTPSVSPAVPLPSDPVTLI